MAFTNSSTYSWLTSSYNNTRTHTLSESSIWDEIRTHQCWKTKYGTGWQNHWPLPLSGFRCCHSSLYCPRPYTSIVDNMVVLRSGRCCCVTAGDWRRAHHSSTYNIRKDANAHIHMHTINNTVLSDRQSINKAYFGFMSVKTICKLEKVALDGSVECCVPPPRWRDLELWPFDPKI